VREFRDRVIRGMHGTPDEFSMMVAVGVDTPLMRSL